MPKLHFHAAGMFHCHTVILSALLVTREAPLTIHRDITSEVCFTADCLCQWRGVLYAFFYHASCCQAFFFYIKGEISLLRY
uniref:Uncharacterized protein n=1 Tax=Anguilla anguilla TaxID=7936 RepID=A0A0E9WQF2_ANGAN